MANPSASGPTPELPLPPGSRGLPLLGETLEFLRSPHRFADTRLARFGKVYQSHLLGKPHGLTSRNPEHCPEMERLARLQRDIDQWYVAYADATPEQALEEIVAFEFIGGGHGAMSRRDILLHVVNHTTYHRGHAADMLYHLGVFPPTTDLPVFLKQPAASDAPRQARSVIER